MRRTTRSCSSPNGKAIRSGVPNPAYEALSYVQHLNRGTLQKPVGVLNLTHEACALARECSRLIATGLTPRDVAMALRLDLGEVLAWLRMSSGRP
jgi:transcriptional regulator GlxA family with amidase domain